MNRLKKNHKKVIMIIAGALLVSMGINKFYNHIQCKYWYSTTEIKTDKSGYEWEYNTCEKIQEVTGAETVVFAVVDNIMYFDICGNEENILKYSNKAIKQIKDNKYKTTVVRMYNYNDSINNAYFTKVIQKE